MDLKVLLNQRLEVKPFDGDYRLNYITYCGKHCEMCGFEFKVADANQYILYRICGNITLMMGGVEKYAVIIGEEDNCPILRIFQKEELANEFINQYKALL